MSCSSNGRTTDCESREMDAGFESPKTAKIRSLKILPWWWNGEVSLPVYKEIYKCNLPNSVNAKSV